MHPKTENAADNKSFISKEQWFKWITELFKIAKIGMLYSESDFGTERYQRINNIAAEMANAVSDLSLEQIKGVFDREIGYPTPKLLVRAAVFRDDKILLVKERSGKWSLPGGWVEMQDSIVSAAEREVKEEAGLDVCVDKVISIEDRDKHHSYLYMFKVIKILVECKLLGGHFQPNNETSDSGFFSLDEIPELDEIRVTQDQIDMCFKAHNDDKWKTIVE